MRRAWLNAPILLLSLSIASLAFADAQRTQGEKAKAGTPESADASGQDSGPKKDAKGERGLSPFMELVNQGAAAYLAQDYAKAEETFQKAIESAPDRALGHYLLGETFLANKKPEQAEQSLQTALRYAEKDKGMHAKVLFSLADLRERQGKTPEAATAWKDCETFLAANAGVGYPSTATERQRVIAARADLATKYAKVKERIEQRQREAAEQSAKDAQKNSEKTK